MSKLLFTVLLLALLLTNILELHGFMQGLRIFLAAMLYTMRFVFTDPFRMCVFLATVKQVCITYAPSAHDSHDEERSSASILPNGMLHRKARQEAKEPSSVAVTCFPGGIVEISRKIGSVWVPSRRIILSISKSIMDPSGTLMSGFFIPRNGKNVLLSYGLTVTKQGLTALLFRDVLGSGFEKPIAVLENLKPFFESDESKPRLRLDGVGVQFSVELTCAEKHPQRNEDSLQRHAHYLEEIGYSTVAEMSITSPLPDTRIISNLNLQTAEGGGGEQVRAEEKKNESPLEAVYKFFREIKGYSIFAPKKRRTGASRKL